jgi:hypothetical protein
MLAMSLICVGFFLVSLFAFRAFAADLPKDV